MALNRNLLATAFAGALLLSTAYAQTPPQMKMTTPIPPSITTPDSVDTRLGTLKFFDGFPDDATVQKVYNNLDFERGVQAFMSGMPGASLVGMRTGFQKLGAVNGTILVFENLLDSKSLFLTGNTDSVYFSTWLNLKDGPLVVEAPPKVLAFLDDSWFQYVTDIGNAGRDKGQGGKYLVLPPGYKGEVPEGYFVAQSRTYNLWLMGRGFKVNGDLKPGVESIKKNLRIYPLAQAKNPPETKFINGSGVELNTVHSNDFSYFEELNEVVQEEPSEALDPERLGLFASIGIVVSPSWRYDLLKSKPEVRSGSPKLEIGLEGTSSREALSTICCRTDSTSVKSATAISGIPESTRALSPGNCGTRSRRG